MRYDFPEEMFATVLGGKSIMDLPRISITSLEEGREFIKTYGYDLEDESDRTEVWKLHRLSLYFLKTEILEADEKAPEVISDPKQLEDICNLFLMASQTNNKELQKWACALLRVMHVLSHLRNGPYRTFSQLIQKQILADIDAHTKKQENGVVLGGPTKADEILLNNFEMKKYKTKSSSAIKLFAKRSELALNILDRMGIRFVTNSVFDSFRVLRYLINEHIISVPNVMPEQSKNTLYPANVFFDVMDKLQVQQRTLPNAEIEELLVKALHNSKDSAQYQEKPNDFSGDNYKTIKFIARHLISIPIGKKHLRFFFPYEVQIVDIHTHMKNSAGPSAHAAYKNRQKQAARNRIFGLNEEGEGISS